MGRGLFEVVRFCEVDCHVFPLDNDVLLIWSVPGCKSEWIPKPKLRLERLEHPKRLICRACWRVCAGSFYGAFRKCEMAARVDKVAVQEFAILKLVVIDNYSFRLEFLILHRLELVQTMRVLIDRRMKVYLIQV